MDSAVFIQIHGTDLHSKANVREILRIWQRLLCMLCQPQKSI